MASAGVPTSGRVTSKLKKTNKGRTTGYQLDLSYPTRGGSEESSTIEVSPGSGGGIQIGDHVPIIYDPDDPRHIDLPGGAGEASQGSISIIGLLLTVLCPVFLWRILRSGRAPVVS